MADNEEFLPQFLPRAKLCGLYVITDAQLGGGHLPIARAAISGGARILQLRDKATPPAELLPIARELRRLTREAGVVFLINDRADLALAVEADGVHLGPDDLPIGEARHVLGPQKIIGVTCATPKEAVAAWRGGADYIGCGAIFGTQTKHDAGAAIGLEKLRDVVVATPLPVAAIGGVNLENIASTCAAGAKMACVISAVTSAGNETAMSQAVRELMAILEL